MSETSDHGRPFPTINLADTLEFSGNKIHVRT